MVLKWCPYVVASLYRLYVSNAFGGRAGFYTDKSRVFPYAVLAAIILVWVGLEIKRLELEPGVRQDFPSAHCHPHPIRGGI